MFRRAAAGLVIGLAAATTAGCAFSTIEEGAEITPEMVGLLRAGMTKEEVLKAFGPPEEFRRPELLDVLMSESVAAETVDPSAAIFNDVFTYRYTKGSIRIFTVILFTWMSTDLESDDVVVFFDEEDRVKYFSHRLRAGGRP